MTFYACPVCNGCGNVSRPPYVPEEMTTWVTYPCPACAGAKVLWKGTDPGLEARVDKLEKQLDPFGVAVDSCLERMASLASRLERLENAPAPKKEDPPPAINKDTVQTINDTCALMERSDPNSYQALLASVLRAALNARYATETRNGLDELDRALVKLARCVRLAEILIAKV